MYYKHFHQHLYVIENSHETTNVKAKLAKHGLRMFELFFSFVIILLILFNSVEIVK